MAIRNLLFVAFALLYFNSIKSQTSKPDTLRAVKVSQPIHIDGDLKKAVWQSSSPITNFTQREPVEGAQSTEQTKVAVLYDTHNIYLECGV